MIQRFRKVAGVILCNWVAVGACDEDQTARDVLDLDQDCDSNADWVLGPIKKA